MTGTSKPAPALQVQETGALPVPPAGRNEQIRIRENFNSHWRFKRQATGMGELGSMDRENGKAALIEPPFRNAHRENYDDSEWQSITLPHTWNAYDTTDAAPGYWRGIGWYRKHFRLGAQLAGKRLFLEFEGVNSVSEFWLNGQRLGEHKGGYTGFEFDITDLARLASEPNVITVKVDNLYHPDIPPTVKSDYNFYGGIYRYTWLRITDPTYIRNLSWTTPAVSEQLAALHFESHIVNTLPRRREVALVQEVFSPDQVLITRVSSALKLEPHGTVSVVQDCEPITRPRLWSPAEPHLYRIASSITEGGRPIDKIENPLGFRWYRFDPQKGLILNGRRVQIQGTNWHQVYPGMGNALPKSRHWEDMKMIREMGANFWRTSHYPHDSATLEASDHLGLMVWEELPINKEVGQPEEYISNVLHMAEEMIQRDHNHPSIIVWGLAGELNTPLATAKRVVGAVAQKYRTLDPSRPVAMHSPGSDEIEALVDVVGVGAGKEADAKHIKYPRRPYMIAEYSVATTGRGIYGMGPESEERACIEHERYLSQLNQRPWMAGGAIWHQYDYDGETYDTVVPHVVAFGMTDVWRIPKEVYYFYQSQWSNKDFVHIAGHWTWPESEGGFRTVKVYSTAGEVELYLNGRSLGKKEPVHFPGLSHPPFIWKVRYEPGTLTAVASGAAGQIQDERRTAGPPQRILLSSDLPRLEADNPENIAYLTAAVVDKDATIVPSSNHPVTFTLFGPGELLKQCWLGDKTGWTWNVIAGKTRVAFRPNSRVGTAMISACSPGLRMGRINLDLVAKGRPDEMNYHD